MSFYSYLNFLYFHLQRSPAQRSPAVSKTESLVEHATPPGTRRLRNARRSRNANDSTVCSASPVDQPTPDHGDMECHGIYQSVVSCGKIPPRKWSLLVCRGIHGTQPLTIGTGIFPRVPVPRPQRFGGWVGFVGSPYLLRMWLEPYRDMPLTL